MAQIYKAPEEWVPDYTTRDCKAERDREHAYIERIATLAKQNGTHPLLGEIYRVPMADGYAQYIVWQTKPLHLVWLEFGDAWQMSDAEARGTRLADIQNQVDFEAKWKKLVAKQKSGV